MAADIPTINELEARPLAEQAVRSLAELTAEIAAERAANKVAHKVVEEIFLHLGIDINDKDAVRELKENMAFLNRANRGAVEIKKAVIKTCVGAAVAGALGLFWLGFKDWIFTLPILPH